MPLELGRRIDYIMVRCVEHGPTLEISACARVFDEPVDGVWASDHLGVVADLSAPTSSGRRRTDRLSSSRYEPTCSA
jgi:endonuclease/exonuclease/phosphatase family metal-dependent hydrolase